MLPVTLPGLLTQSEGITGPCAGFVKGCKLVGTLGVEVPPPFTPPPFLPVPVAPIPTPTPNPGPWTYYVMCQLRIFSVRKPTKYLILLFP